MVVFFKGSMIRHGFEALPRDDEHISQGAIRVYEQLDDRGRDIA